MAILKKKSTFVHETNYTEKISTLFIMDDVKTYLNSAEEKNGYGHRILR